MRTFSNHCLVIASAGLLAACGGSSRPPESHITPPVTAAQQPQTAQSPKPAETPKSPAPKPSEKPSPSPSPVAETGLSIQFLSAGRTNTLPRVTEESVQNVLAFNQSLKAEKGIQARYVYDETLVLPRQGERPVFLVIGPKAFGKEIAEAYFTQQIKTRGGAVTELQKEAPVAFEPDPARWFVELAKLFPRRSDVDPQATQVIRLRFVFRDWSRFEATVEFRAWGGPPELSVSSDGASWKSGMPANPAAFVQRTLKDGWIVEESRIQNNTARPARVWYRVRGGSSLQHSVTVRTPVFEDFPYFDSGINYKPSEQRDYKFQVSEAAFGIVGAHVNGQWISLAPDSWSYVDVPAKASARIDWEAKRAPGYPMVVLQSRVRDVVWNYKTGLEAPNCHGMPPCSNRYVQKVNETPEILGSDLKGTWDREIRVSDPALDRAVATREDLDRTVLDQVQPILGGQVPFEFTQGTSAYGHAEVVWQGVPTF